MRRILHAVVASAMLVVPHICLVLANVGLVRAQSVEVYLTTPDLRQALAPQPSVVLGGGATSAVTIRIDEKVTYQQMDGFGASLTDSSAWLIQKLAPEPRERLMRQLFDREAGIGISFLRQPLGASDFVLARYSYHDEPDFSLGSFSISHDESYILPLLREARALNPQLKVMATPWSPPGWMKTSGSMLKGRLLTNARDAWAEYLAKSVQAYEAAGVPIYAVSVQNEPTYLPADYPGMAMGATEQSALLRDHVGPAFARAGLGAKVLVFDDNWKNGSFAGTVLGDAGAAAVAAGAAFHCYNGDPSAQSAFHDRFPDKDVWETECSPGLWSRGGNQLQDQATLLMGATRNWARSVVLWNLALNAQNGPRTGGCKTCTPVVTVRDDISPASAVLNAEYYALGHLSKFVVPGAHRVSSETDGSGAVQHVAFRNPDGSLVLLAANRGSIAAAFDVSWSGQSFAYTLPGGSLATFRWAPLTLPAVALSANPGGLALNPGGSAALELSVAPQQGSGAEVTLTCSGLPAGATCAITPPALQFATAEAATARVTVTTTAIARTVRTSAPLLAFALLGVCVLPRRRRLLAVIVVVLAMAVACGVSPIPGKMHQLTITATPNSGAATVITVPVRIGR